jgi:hypothetical protein
LRPILGFESTDPVAQKETFITTRRGIGRAFEDTLVRRSKTHEAAFGVASGREKSADGAVFAAIRRAVVFDLHFT